MNLSVQQQSPVVSSFGGVQGPTEHTVEFLRGFFLSLDQIREVQQLTFLDILAFYIFAQYSYYLRVRLYAPGSSVCNRQCRSVVCEYKGQHLGPDDVLRLPGSARVQDL